MPTGVIFALSAYLLYSCCDAIIKGFGTDLAVFEIAFWTALFSFLPAISPAEASTGARACACATHFW